MRTKSIPVVALVLALVLAFLVPAASASATIRAYICITGSDSSQLAPGTSRWQYPPSGSIAYFNDGTENGCLYEDFPAGTTNVKVWTTYNNTTSQTLTQDISTSPTFNFNTHKLTLKLTKCDNTPLNGGTAIMKVGGVTHFFPAPNSTGTDGDGKTSAEVFPGTYGFEMRYNATTEWKDPEVIPDADHEILWKTTLVSLVWPGQISYGGAAGDSTWFNKPAMEMMPGTVRFHFRPVGGHPGYTSDLTFSGCTYSGGFLTLVDEAGNPLANYPADYPAEQRNLKWKYRCGGSWGPTTSFQTDAYGKTPFSIGCGNWDKKITMTLNQTAVEQDVTQNATFQAAKVITELRDHQGNLITDTPGGTVAQGGGYWYTHGTTGPTGQVTFYTFPANIKVRMTYGNVGQEKFPPIVAGTNTVTWYTGQVTVLSFFCPAGAQVAQGGSWFSYGAESVFQLLPGTFNYKGCGTGQVTVAAQDTSTIPPALAGSDYRMTLPTGLKDVDFNWVDQDAGTAGIQIDANAAMVSSDKTLEVTSTDTTGAQALLGRFSKGGPDGSFLKFEILGAYNHGSGVVFYLNTTFNSLAGYTGSRADKIAFRDSYPVGTTFVVSLEFYNADGSPGGPYTGNNNLPGLRDMYMLWMATP